MYTSSKMTKSGEPSAFLPSTFKELKVHETTGNYSSATVGYSIDSYWISSRRNGRMGLTFGTRELTFRAKTLSELSPFQNFTYQQFLDAVEVPLPYRERYKQPTKPVTQDYASRIIILWDGVNIWHEGGGNIHDIVGRILPEMVNVYPKLPQLPANADGWYKLV